MLRDFILQISRLVTLPAVVILSLSVTGVAADLSFEVPNSRLIWESLLPGPYFGQAVPSGLGQKAEAAPGGPEQHEVSAGLNIFILVGNDAVNSIASRSASQIILEVRDRQSLPVEGAEVKIQLPAAGPGGAFQDHTQSWTGRTDANGQVVVPAFTPNQEPGRFKINVVARYAGTVGTASFIQTNSTADVAIGSRHSNRRRLWKIVAIAGAAGVVGGIVWATHSGDGKNTVVLQPGVIAVGAPR